MRSLRKFATRKNNLGCGICCLAAFILFEITVTQERSKSSNDEPKIEGLQLKKKSTKNSDTAEEDEASVSLAMKVIEKAVRHEKILIEFIDCHISRWFKDSLHPVLTRNHESFKEDDSFASDARVKFKRRVAFFCTKFTGGRQTPPKSDKAFLSWGTTKSHLYRRFEALDLLLIVTRQPITRDKILQALQFYPHDFKEIIHLNSGHKNPLDAVVSCTKNIFTRIPFGFRMRFATHHMKPRLRECLIDWKSSNRRNPCPIKRSVRQTIRHSVIGENHLNLNFFSDSAPCFNMSVKFGYYVSLAVNSPRLPVYIDNSVSAYAFDQKYPSVGIQGHVANKFVLGIMILLGASVWFLTGTPFTETILNIICAISSSADLSGKLKDRARCALFFWILGNLFFSFILVEDMTSTISVPDASRITRLSECARAVYTTDAGTEYKGHQVMHFWKWIADGKESRQKWILCASSSEIDEIVGFFDIRNLYRIPLDNYGQKFMTFPPREYSKKEEFDFVLSYADNFESNEYALILLRYDLLKQPIRRQEKHQKRLHRTQIDLRYGCCKNTTKVGKKLAFLLARYGNIPPSSLQSEAAFPTMLLAIGFCAAFLHFFFRICWEFSLWSRIFLKLRRRAALVGI